MSNGRNLSNLLGGNTTLSADNVEGVQKKEVTSDTTGLGTGDQADQKFVAGQKSLYLYNGTGWDRVLSGTDGPPQWDSGGSVVAKPRILNQSHSFDTNLATLDSQRITLSVTAVDPDGFPIVYDFDEHPSPNNVIDSVQQTSAGTFRLSPNIMSGESNANDTVSFRILASDGARVTTASTIIGMTYSKFSIFKKGAAAPGFWGTTYGSNYNYGGDGQSGIGDELIDVGQTMILNKFGEYWLLPKSNFTADLKMWGAAGSTASDGVVGAGDDYDGGHTYSGFGGYTYARMDFTAGQYYTIIVGQGGAFGTGNGNSHGPPGGFGGGGNAGRANNGGMQHGRGSGGGLTGIFLGKEFANVNDAHAAALLIAGGGGGGFGQVGGGGSAGGLEGTRGYAASSTLGGYGGTQSAGGATSGGGYGAGTAGGKLLGGSRGRTSVHTPGGGGGGYYGGGTGNRNNYAGGPGGGGSGYIKSDASITNSGMNTALAYNVDGPSPGRDEPEWGDNAGVGHFDHGSTTANPYTGGGDDETDIGGWRRSYPGRFAIIPVA